jgi:hypothetical protein
MDGHLHGVQPGDALALLDDDGHVLGHGELVRFDHARARALVAADDDSAQRWMQVWHLAIPGRAGGAL